MDTAILLPHLRTAMSGIGFLKKKDNPALLPIQIAYCTGLSETKNHPNAVALDLREAHREDFFSVPEDSVLKGLLQAADETQKDFREVRAANESKIEQRRSIYEMGEKEYEG